MVMNVIKSDSTSGIYRNQRLGLLAAGDDNTHYICALFERVKYIYKCAEGGGSTDITAETEVNNIRKVFIGAGDYKGSIYCQKALAIIFETRGDGSAAISERLYHYEAAHDTINEAIIDARKHKWLQTSLLKRAAILKCKLAEVLHLTGDDVDATILEKRALAIFTEMLKDNPAYGEGYLELAFWGLKKQWQPLDYIEASINKAEILLNAPQYKKHLPTEEELQKYKVRIEEMRKSIIFYTVTNI